ncbi:hypothetical protein [Actinomadura sp. DC4]|uniref:hypothetical protein n=1 Tax=Actinomadura sp. DC4 TaxID=3055069 RepID=UPI0025B1555E|nr:hypothetical protein [Actinomadura sp. DC4]MDN3351960.1 hypothetical protein [Actinomadura sp. DC4]
MRAAPRTATAAAAGALGMLALTACGSRATRASIELPPISGPTPSASRSVTPAVPDLLINQAQPFTESQVRRLRHLDEVSRLALIGYGLVWVYGEQIPTATVDPATYRAFTSADTSDATAVWKAVTDGSALVSHSVGERDHLPLDAAVPAGWATVRIAGLATTVPGIDMVVSSTTGKQIGVSFGNGLVVAVEGDSGRATAKIRHVLGAAPVIRRIAASSDALGPPSGPLLPSVTPTITPNPNPNRVAPGAPGAPADLVRTPSPVRHG